MQGRARLAMVGMAVLTLAGCPARQEPRRPPPPVLPPANAAQLVGALRQGGLVLFVRHAAAAADGQSGRIAIADCATQGNLTTVGRAQAADIAAAVARLHIPIGAVRSSPYCRCADTARLAFGYLLLDDDLLPLRQADARARLAAVRRLLGTPPLPGRNTVLVGHADTIDALTGFALDEGEMLLVRPAPSGGSFAPVGRIRADQWAGLAAGP